MLQAHEEARAVFGCLIGPATYGDAHLLGYRHRQGSTVAGWSATTSMPPWSANLSLRARRSVSSFGRALAPAQGWIPVLALADVNADEDVDDSRHPSLLFFVMWRDK